MNKILIFLTIMLLIGIFSCNNGITLNEEKEIIQSVVKETTTDINYQIKSPDIDLFFYNQSSYLMDYILSEQTLSRSNNILKEGSYNDELLS